MGLIIFLVVFALVFGFSYYQRQETNRLWGSVANELGLSFKPASVFSLPEMGGTIGGTRVEISGVTQGGNNKSTYTRYEVHHRPVGPPLTLTKQGSLSMLGRLVGRRDVEIGDPFFDERVVIDSRSPEQLPLFLSPARRAAVLDLFASWPDGRFQHDSIRVSSRGLERNRHRLTSTIMRMVETAEVMGEPGEVDAILERQQAGAMGEAAEQFHVLNEQEPNAFRQILEAEVLVEMGRHEEAAEIFGDLDRRLPEDPSLSHWLEVAELPPPPPPPAPSAERWEQYEREILNTAPDPAPAPVPDAAAGPDAMPASAPAPAITKPLDQQAVIDDLFAANRMSWQIVEYFEANYQNAVVEWRGEVTALNTFLHDSDFGEGPGVKATVLLGRSGNSDFISNEVHAMVQFPEDTEFERGTELGFRGTLVHVDRFSRKVYVQWAVVTD